MSPIATSSQFARTVIRASAGTGKTFQLSNRYLGLLNAGVAPDQILATTFTRKAAAEILDRIVVRLAEAASDRKACAQLGEFIGDRSLTCERCRQQLVGLLRGLHRLQVSTLDSFFGQMARSVSLEVGLSPAWKIVDQLQDAVIRDEAIEAVIHGEETNDLLTLTHLLTKGEASRTVGQLIRTTVNDLESLFQETDADAWHALPYEKPLADDEFVLLIEDLRTLAMPDKRFEKARDEDYARALVGDWEGFIAKGLAAKVLADETTYYKKPIPDAALSIYKRLLKHARSLLLRRIAQQTEGSYELLKKFDAEYATLKREQHASRFDDITRFLARSLRNPASQPNASGTYRQMAFRLDANIHHLLLDEFQDTAPAQWDVLRPFAQRVTSGKGGNSFFCVGDTKQAIYGWRGGVAEIFDAISSELTGLEETGLNASFRSSEAVIETVNEVFEHAADHTNLGRAEEAVRNWCQRFERHTTRRGDLAGYVSLETAPEEEELLEFTAQRVAEFANQSPRLTVGVLVRRNDTVGRLIGLLRGQGILASEEGGNPLTDSAAVLLILSLMQLADHPGDTVARFHVATSPLGQSVGFTNYSDDKSCFRVSRQARRSLIEIGYGPTVAAWAASLSPHGTPRERSRLAQLVELAFGYQQRATSRVDDFVRFVEQQRVADPTSAQVRVMTIHQAKGLEFDIVVLPELEGRLIGQPDSFVVHRETPVSPPDRVCRYVNSDIQQLLPKKFQQMFEDATDRTVTESLCVLYVALTRAVHALHMIIAPSKESERVIPLTSAGLLRAALRGNEPALPSALLYENGDRDWFERVRHIEPAAVATREPLPVKISLAKAAKHRRRGLDRQSPSGFEGGTRVNMAELLQPRQSSALARGTLIHAWFEQVTWSEAPPPDEKALRQVANELRREEATSLDIEQELAAFREMLRHPSVIAALSHAAYDNPASLGFDKSVGDALSSGKPRLVVENERTFAVRNDSQLLNGSIDRIVWIYAAQQLVAADIIDFKTDVVEDDDAIDKKREYYRPQLESYRDAVCRMSGLKPERVIARLVFVGRGLVVRVV
ncbi:MAG: UvrD-helicase domain-containing protein [Planctomycetia bacterium]|nr:UvrD-helicase domain-containing protein [Planctomycetia bacterium]